MEGVATRAGTSRTVLARRWDKRSDLAVAAIKNYNTHNPVKVPDLGSVREEMILLLKKLSERGSRTTLKVFLSMNDYFIETNSTLADLREKLIDGNIFADVIARGIARGELDQRRMTPRILALPLDLLRHEVIMTRKPVSKELIVEIVDTIFLPLVATRAAD
jgi:hypothetical protein